MNKNNFTRGYIALSTVLVVTAVLLLLGVGMLVRGVLSARVDLRETTSIQASILAHTCAEVALLRLQGDVAYEGSETVAIGTQECHIETISGSGAIDRVIQTWSTVQDTTFRVEVGVVTLAPVVRVDTWDVVDTF